MSAMIAMTMTIFPMKKRTKMTKFRVNQAQQIINMQNDNTWLFEVTNVNRGKDGN